MKAKPSQFPFVVFALLAHRGEVFQSQAVFLSSGIWSHTLLIIISDTHQRVCGSVLENVV